jgi:AraC-like DNA-binding protein
VPVTSRFAHLAFCRDNLHDADLSPQHAADHVGISLRTLHSRFGQIGQTFGRCVLQSRLEACARALHDPNQRSRTFPKSPIGGDSTICRISTGRFAHISTCPRASGETPLSPARASDVHLYSMAHGGCIPGYSPGIGALKSHFTPFGSAFDQHQLSIFI